MLIVIIQIQRGPQINSAYGPIKAWAGPGLSTARALQNDLQQATGVNVSAQTIRNRLHEGGLRAQRPVLCKALSWKSLWIKGSAK